MKKKLNSFLSILAILLIITAVLIALFVGVLIYSVCIPRQYVTTDIADYGKYTGNYDNKTVQAFIDSFFPEEIESTFSNVSYSYRAQKNDAYAFEAYLSFNVENDEHYRATVEKYTTGLQQSEFRYDGAYTQYLLVDKFSPGSIRNEDTSDVNIRYAEIGKILCDPEKNEIIFVALGVYDGGIAKTDFLTVYFDRFQIDPLEYGGHVTKGVVPSPEPK
jgi:hypothetical protein